MLAALLFLLLGVLAYWLGVGNVLGQRAEASVLEASDFTESPPAPLSLVSVPMIVLALAVIALVALWSHGIGRAISVLVFGMAALVASQLLKNLWLERPQLFELDASNTFPSGHMTVFAVLCAASIWAVPRGARAAVAVMSAFLLGVVSWQLLHFGWHRPSDVLGALFLVSCSFAVAAWIGPRRSRRGAAQPSVVNSVISKVALITLSIAGIALVLGGLALILLATNMRSDELMLAAGTISLIGVSAVNARVLVALAP